MKQEEQMLEEQYDEISIKELIETIWGYKFLIILITVFGAIVAFSAAQVIQSREDKVETVVSLEWNGLVDGQYPDGDRFIYNNMFESYVISDALVQSGLSNLSVSDIRAQLRVIPIVPGNVVELVQQRLEAGEQITYYATEYKLVINAGLLEMTNDEGKLFLEYLTESFKDDFESKYINRAIVLQYDNVDLSTYDYDETYQVLMHQLDMFESIIESALETGSGFTSNSLQIGFDDLLSKINLIRDVEMKNIDTRVNNYMLTKELDFRISRFEYSIELDTLELNKATDYETELINNITQYTGNETVVIIPGIDTEYSVDPYINTIYDELLSTQEIIANLENEIAYSQAKMDNLILVSQDNNGSSEEYQEQVLLVEDAIQMAEENSNQVALNLEIMLEEYSRYITRNTVTPLTSPQVSNDVNVMLYTAIGTVLGGMISLGVIFLRETLKRDE